MQNTEKGRGRQQKAENIHNHEVLNPVKFSTQASRKYFCKQQDKQTSCCIFSCNTSMHRISGLPYNGSQNYRLHELQQVVAANMELTAPCNEREQRTNSLLLQQAKSLACCIRSSMHQLPSQKHMKDSTITES